tara:strand:+ start:42 stop:749 length:708 start_codon:yes stop_codon:yes gene_type:complete
MTIDIAFCVPATSNGREWKTIQETYLWDILFNQLERKTPNNMNITVFVGFDYNDKIYSVLENRLACDTFFEKFKIEWIGFTAEYKGKPTWIWNVLSENAFDSGFEYIKVLGDDITLPNDKDWLSAMVNKLKKNNNIGWSAGYSNNDNIATQFLLHKTHYDIFKFIFPPQIEAWFCDNFLNEIYPDKYKNWLKTYHLLNVGGQPRYEPKNDKLLCSLLIRRYKPLLTNHLRLNLLL